MNSAIAALVLALLFALAIIGGIAAFTFRRYRAASPDQRQEMRENYRRSTFIAGAMMIVLGWVGTSSEVQYSSLWWFDIGFIGLGVILLIASLVGIPSWVARDN